jgi:hypothetical protein
LDYGRIYSQLMERAKGRQLSGYAERHHIVPRCMGGGDEAANIAVLTGAEHYVAHQLLAKMHPGNHRLLWALSAMTAGCRNTPRPHKRYEWLKRRFGEMVRERCTGLKASPEARAKMSKARKGVRLSAEHRAAIGRGTSIGRKGIKFSAEHRANLAKSKIGNKNRLGGRKFVEA